MSIAIGTGYGYTESVLNQGDSHHRLQGAVVVEAAPLSWLGAGLRFDGRYDSHSFATGPSDSGWTGDPRLFLRADRQVGDASSLGARAVLWLPGTKAPSITPSATTADLLALLTHAPGDGSFGITANAGYRIDSSAKSATDAARLGPGDRLALEVSGFDAALLGLAAAYRQPGYQLFAEWSWDVLVGSGAPSASASPMLVGFGGRARVSEMFTAEVLAQVSPSARPAMDAAAPLVPVPPRFALLFGLSARFGGEPPARAAAPPPARVVAEVARAELTGELSAGGALPPGTTITVKSGAQEIKATPDAAGKFSLADLAPGPAVVTATADGYEPASADVNLEGGKPVAVQLAMKRKLPQGQIRGTVRSFGGRGVDASVRVEPVADAAKVAVTPGEPAAPPVEVRAQGGAFQIDVRPGNYDVTIEATGYDTQKRSVRVEENGVTVLNADMRRTR